MRSAAGDRVETVTTLFKVKNNVKYAEVKGLSKQRQSLEHLKSESERNVLQGSKLRQLWQGGAYCVGGQRFQECDL